MAQKVNSPSFCCHAFCAWGSADGAHVPSLQLCTRQEIGGREARQVSDRPLANASTQEPKNDFELD
jgi:hypothetical protein